MEHAATDAPGESGAAVGVEEAIRMVRHAREEVEAASVRHNSPSQNVNVGDKGGERVAVWLLLVASALVLGMNLSQMNQISDLKMQVRRLEDYQTTTYLLVPELRKQVEERLSKQRKE